MKRRSMAGWIRGNWNAWSVSNWSKLHTSVEVAVAEVRAGLCLLVGRGHNHHTALPTSVVCQLGLDASQAVQALETRVTMKTTGCTHRR